MQPALFPGKTRKQKTSPNSQHLTCSASFFFFSFLRRRHVVRGGFGEEEGGGDRGRDAVRGAGEHLQGEVRGAVGGPPTPTTPSSKPLRKGACRWCSVVYV